MMASDFTDLYLFLYPCVCICICRWKIFSGSRWQGCTCVRFALIAVVRSALNIYFSQTQIFHGLQLSPPNQFFCEQKLELKDILTHSQLANASPSLQTNGGGRFYVHFRSKWGVSVCRGTRLRFGQLWPLTLQKRQSSPKLCSEFLYSAVFTALQKIVMLKVPLCSVEQQEKVQFCVLHPLPFSFNHQCLQCLSLPHFGLHPASIQEKAFYCYDIFSLSGGIESQQKYRSYPYSGFSADISFSCLCWAGVDQVVVPV